LFFIWHMPLILGFISYLVRVLFALIWGYFLIIFWYFAKKFMRVFRRAFIWVYFYCKVYDIKFKRVLRKRYRAMFKLKRNLIVRVNKLFLLLSMLLEKLYDNVSIWFRLRNSALRKSEFGFFYRIISLLKNGNIELFNYRFYRSKYSSLLKKALKISITKDIFFNIFVHIKENVDNFFIDRLEPLNHNIKHMNWYLNKSEVSKFNILRFGSVLHKLNLESISTMVHQFVSTYDLDDYDKTKLRYKFKYIDRYRLIIFRFLLLVYWELIFPINHLIFCVVLRVSLRFYIVCCFLLYILRCILFLLLYVLKFIFYILVIIFAGKEK
jgi:hypothetical protein